MKLSTTNPDPGYIRKVGEERGGYKLPKQQWDILQRSLFPAVGEKRTFTMDSDPFGPGKISALSCFWHEMWDLSINLEIAGGRPNMGLLNEVSVVTETLASKHVIRVLTDRRVYDERGEVDLKSERRYSEMRASISPSGGFERIEVCSYPSGQFQHMEQKWMHGVTLEEYLLDLLREINKHAKVSERGYGHGI